VIGGESHTSASKITHSEMHSHFKHFANVKTSEDSNYLKIESNGMPEHNMMEGITSWQQQVPLPQNYTGGNSWKVPLKPVLAESPMMTRDHFHKGAIAIAVNGVPIFNALNNRGEYAADIGELDKWGGHSGRADDYHYHLAPEHLETIVGKGNPIAYALDGFPLYAKTDDALDKYLGRFNEDGSYQYHAVDYPPYLIAGLRGEVHVDTPSNAPEDQIVPQPRSQSPRHDDYGPLRDAKITGLKKLDENHYSLEYTLNDKQRRVDYSWDENFNYKFVFIDEKGNQKLESYHGESGKFGGPSEAKAGRAVESKQARKYCGDGLCDDTESGEQCQIDCSDEQS